MLRRASKAAARLERALSGESVPHDAETRRAVAAAGALAPGHTRSPARIEQTREAMMAAYYRALNPVEGRADAGTTDGLDEIDLHKTEFALPDGGELVVSNLEEITPQQLEELAAILADKARDHQS